MRLKKQNIQYVPVATPRTPAWYAPHVFHGIKGDVTVPESSKVLLKFSGFKPLSLNSLENILPGTTMARYWSEVVALKKIQVPAVFAISDQNI